MLKAAAASKDSQLQQLTSSNAQLTDNLHEAKKQLQDMQERIDEMAEELEGRRGGCASPKSPLPCDDTPVDQLQIQVRLLQVLCNCQMCVMNRRFASKLVLARAVCCWTAISFPHVSNRINVTSAASTVL